MHATLFFFVSIALILGYKNKLKMMKKDEEGEDNKIDINFFVFLFYLKHFRHFFNIILHKTYGNFTVILLLFHITFFFCFCFFFLLLNMY